jgi:hypothetical protein
LRRSGAVFLAAVALAGCGGGGGDDGGDDQSRASIIIADASRKTLAAGTAREHVEAHTEPNRSMDFETEGVVDFKADDTRGTFTYHAFEGLDPGTKIEAITHDEIDYFKLPGDENWVKTETAPQDAIANSTDGASSLRWLGIVTDDARVQGKQAIRGTQTTRYSAVIDLRKVGKEIPAGERLAYSAVVQAFKNPRIPVTVWIDDRTGLIRRMHHELPFSNIKAPPPEGEKALVATADWYDFGVEARVEPPPPDQTEEE